MIATTIAWGQVFRLTERIIALRRSWREEAAGKRLNRDARAGHPRGMERDRPDTEPNPRDAPDMERDTANADESGPKFEMRTWSGPEGSRNYRLYVPSTLRGPPRALIVMLHGCKQTPQDFATGTGMNALAEEHGLIVAYPSQSRTKSALRCWNWFHPSNQRRGEGEPAIIAGITGQLMEEFSVERSDTFIAGLSAGGAMTVIMGDCYPDLFSAVGVHSGLPCHTAYSAFSALALMRGKQGFSLKTKLGLSVNQPVRTIVFQGTADMTVHPDNAEQIASAARAGTEFETERATGKSEGGRRYGAAAARSDDGRTLTEVWMIEGANHGWSGGSEAGSYTDPAGPDASAEMLRFFLEDRTQAK